MRSPERGGIPHIPDFRRNVRATPLQTSGGVSPFGLTFLKAQVSSPEAWEKFKAGALSSGISSLADMSYEEAVKEFNEPKIRIQSEPMAFHKLEFDAIDEIIQLLGLRSWTLLTSYPDSRYITCDRPVVILWTAPGAPTVCTELQRSSIRPGCGAEVRDSCRRG